MASHTGSSSPDLISFDDDPEILSLSAAVDGLNANSASVGASTPARDERSSSAALPPAAPVEIAPVGGDDDDDERAVLHFFVACTGVDGSLVAAPTRSAQTLVRGALSMLTQTTSAAMNGKPARPKATDVNVEVRVSRELPLHGTSDETSAATTEWTSSTASKTLGFAEKKALPAAGLLDSENYWSERHKSRNPRFSVGFSVRCRSAAALDRHVQIMVMVPDEGSTSNRNSQLFGYAQTSFQEMWAVATSGDFHQRLTLPVHSSVRDGATVELQFADLQPQQHPLFRSRHNLFRSFLFYPLMRPEHEELQAANATLAVEEAAEVAFSVLLPLQLLRVSQFELLQMYDDWKTRYTFARKKNRHFEDDAEALSFGHDVFRVQVVCGRDLRVKGASGGSIQAEETDFSMRMTSRPATFSMGGPNGLVRRIKSGKWGNSGGSGSFSSDGGVDPGLDSSSGVHPFVVIKFEDGVSGNHEFTVGKTNTEYDSPSPVWSTNTFASSKCPHGKPSTKFYAATALRSRVVVSPVNALKEFVFYRPHATQDGGELSGWLRFQVFNESCSYMNGMENELIGEVMIPLQSVRDAMTVEEKIVFDDEDNASEGVTAKPRQVVTSLTLVDWFDVHSPATDEVFGQIQLRLNVLLANPVAPSNDELLFVEQESSSSQPRRYRRATDSSPPPADGPLENEMPLNFVYPHVLNLRKHVAEVTDMIRLCEHLVEEKKTFKSSLHKKRADIQAIPTNLHVAYFRIFRHFGSQSLPPPPMDAQASTEDLLGLDDVETPESAASIAQTYLAMHEHLRLPETHATVTCGAPTAHALGLTDYGLREMELDMHYLQGILEKCTPTLMESSASAGDVLVAEDSTAFAYSSLDDGDQTDGEDDWASSDSGVSSDAATSTGAASPPTESALDEEKPPLKKKGSKYSMTARVAVGRRAKALSKKRLVRRKSTRPVEQGEADDKSVTVNGYAKYPALRIDADEGVDPTRSINYAVRVLCRLEMLRADYYLRKSVAVSQSVSSLVTCFVAELDLCLQEKKTKVLDQLAQIGFLVGWESLISSHGKELHMISDAWVAVKCLETFAFQLYEADDGQDVSLEKHDEAGYVIKVPVPSTQFALLPEKLQAGERISVTSALFTQGINEMQSLANMVGHSGVSIQRKINSTSFRAVVGYYNRFTESCGVDRPSSASVGSHPDEILRNLRVAVESENSASKNTCILLHAADAVRSLNGGRVTYCKSGKDRTAMSATLEQARLLVQRKRHVLQEIEAGSASEFGPLEEVKAVANTMREFGVRVHIAHKNVGRYKYSFNSLQRKLLPEIYRPPMSTIQDMVTSVTARDS